MPIIVCPRSRAAEVARLHKVSRAISLLDPGTSFPDIDHLTDAHRLKLSVHDIETEAEGLNAPCEKVVDNILTFVSGWDRAAPMLVHCYAGISRSTATAFIAACAHNPDTNENTIALALREASSTASPNRRFVALADAAMGRKGRMIEAINRIGRGPPWQEVGEAQPFTLASRYG